MLNDYGPNWGLVGIIVALQMSWGNKLILIGASEVVPLSKYD